MTTQVLIVHGHLPFAIKLKQTLERSAPFEAHPFTSLEAAVDYLSDHVQDVAVIDFAMTDYTGEQIVQAIRGAQPDIPIIAAPKQDVAKTNALGIAASLNAGFTAQDLINAINRYFSRNERPSLESPGTTALLSRLGKGSQPSPSDTDMPDYSSLDDVLANAAGTNIFEQPVVEGDTPPSAPEELVWQDESSKREPTFDDVLNSLPPDAPKPPPPSSPFNDLVNSMRTEEEHRPLPSRQQQLVEFILSGGTDSLDNEPPKPPPSQTAPLPPPSPEPEPPLEPESEQLPELEADFGFELRLKPPSEPEQAPEFDFGFQPDQEPEPEPEYELEFELEAEPEPEPEFDFDFQLENEPEAEQASEFDFGFQPDQEPEPEYELAFEPEPEPQPEPEFEPDAPPEPPKSPLLSAFDRLSKEEPPTPDFEESGTVSDLVEGLQDRSFRNVLSILSGEEGGEGERADDIAPATPGDFDVGTRRRSSRSSDVPEVYAFEDVESTPARIILQQTLDQTMSGGTFSLEELLSNIDAQLPLHRPKVQPLPSWTRNKDRAQEDVYLVQEPEFLPEELPDESTPVEASEDLYADQTTIAARGQQIEEHPEMLETEWLENRQPAADETYTFPDTLPEEIPADATVPHQPTVPLDATVVNERLADDAAAWDEAFADDTPVSGAGDRAGWDEEAVSDETPAPGVPVMDDEGAGDDTSRLWYDLPEQDFNTQFEMMAAFEVHGETGFASGALYTETQVEPSAEMPQPEPVPESPPAEEDYVAQMALSLTAASLEMTAEAALLARDQQIVAYTGRMPEEEVEELRGTIADDWDAAPGEVRIRFITAPGSGKDYMLYSRRTEADFTLSLIFAGTTPLRDIRRQGKRLVDALQSVPEAPDAPKPPPVSVAAEPDDAAARTPYTCVWLLRDPGAHLDPAASQALTAGLNVQMREQGWTIRSLQVHEDYVYLLADVPGEEPAYQIMRDLKRRSAALAHAQNPAYTDNGLWADGYLVVTPGRDLDTEEIQQFINFERME